MMCNGHIVEKDYLIKDGDLVCVRTYPSASVSWTTVLVVGLIVAATVTVGILAIKFNWWGVRDKLANWLLGDGDDANNDNENEKIPSIKGCRNRSMEGHPVPVMLGKTLITPYYCGNPMTSVSGTDGENQTYTVAFCVGYAPLEVTHIKLGELILSENTQKVENGVIPVSQAEGSAGRFIGNVELKIDSATDDVPVMYPKKLVQENLDFQLLYPEGTTPLKAERFSATFPAKIQIELSMNALFSMDDEGERQAASCSVILAISFDGGATYVPFTALDGATSSADVQITDTSGTVIGTGKRSTIRRNKNKQMRFLATYELSWSQAKYLHEHGNDTAQLFLQKANTDSTDGKTSDAIYCTAIRTWVYDYDKSVASDDFVLEDLVDQKLREKIVCITMRMTASNSFADLNGTLNEFTCTATSKCRTWNGTRWSDADVTTATSNPASVALMLMQSPTLGQYAIPDSKIDMASFGELYEFVEAHKGRRAGSQTLQSLPFAVGGALTSQKKLIDVVNQVLGTARASLTMNGTKYSLVIDKPRDYPVTILNNHSFLKDGVTNSKTFDELPDGYKVKFVNERLGYAEDFLYVMVGNKTSSDPTAVIESTEVVWITNPDLVWQSVVYNHAKRVCRPETWNRKIGIDGNLIEVGNLVSIQDDTILVGIGDGGEIKDLIYNENLTAIIGVKIEAEIGVSDLTQTYGVKILVADEVSGPSVIVRQVPIQTAGYYSRFLFTEPIYLTDTIKPAIGDILSFGIYDRITYDVLCASKKDNGDGTFDFQFFPYDERVYTADTEGIPEFNSKMTNPQVMEEVNQVPQEYVKLSDYTSAINSLIGGNPSAVGDPSAVRSLSCVAGQEGITLAWLQPLQGGLSGTIAYYEIELSKDSGVTYTPVAHAMNLDYLYAFTGADLYKEYTYFARWKFRIRSVNVYGKYSAWTEITVDTTTYGTWLFGQAVPEVKIQQNNSTGRVLQATFTMPPRSDQRVLYGTIRYRVQIQRRLESGSIPVGTEDYDDPTEWWAPATSGNPYGDEDNYKDEGADPDYVLAQETYLQTLPLVGQSFVGGGKTKNTPYRIRVCAQNEAGASGWTYPDPFTATVTGIYDLVKANETSKQEYITELSSLCANLGRITGGSMTGGELNYWTLETLINAYQHDHNKDYMGAFRVGGDDEYLLVIPKVNIDGHTIDGYEIVFKVGKFEISSEYSKLNGEFIVQTDETSLNRTRISPIGTFFEHRNLPTDTVWEVIAKQDVGGIFSQQVYSDETLLLSNSGIEGRRSTNMDIGLPYLSNNSRVYHFDTDVPVSGQYTNILDQYGNTDLTVTLATGGTADEVGEEDAERYGKDVRPAIQVKAPYSEVGKSLYGQFALAHPVGNGNTWTVDCWFQYSWAEGQEVLRVDTDSASVKIENAVAEVNYNEPQGEEPPYNTESQETGDNFIPYNVARGAGCNIVFAHGIQEVFPIGDLGLEITTDEWVHFAMSVTNGNATLLFSTDTLIAKYQAQEIASPYVYKVLTGIGTGGTFTFNATKETMLIDELMIDSATAETMNDFASASIKKIPWAAMSDATDKFMLIKDPDSDLVSNINFADNLVLTDADFEEIK